MSPLPAILRRRRRAPGPPAPFIVGVARSGTTLLRLMLDAHPQMAIPPETHFVPKLVRAIDEGRIATAEAAGDFIASHRRWPDLGLDEEALRERLAAVDPSDAGEVVRVLYRLYADGQGKPRWGDKSPPYVKRMPRLAGALPEARFIHLVRDGRDTALSLLDVSWGPETIADAAQKWRDEIRRARKHARRLGRGRYLELRYEDLVADPEPHLRQICELIELDFDPVMLEYHSRAGERMASRELDIAGKGVTITAADRERQHRLVSEPPSSERSERWREQMAADDQREFERIAGDLLESLGYPLAG